MDVDTALDRLRPHLEELRSYGVERIAIFGSVATGASDLNSDIDILVRFDKNKKKFDNFMDVRFLVEGIFPENKIDLVLEDALKPAIKQKILSEARDVA